ncbi:MAG: hypothetical protein PHT94_01915 [Candidatus Nanoarchaeia archaeon]|nr:hypothetical protein [Candidatus Nanoarchaeia archaeon]
MGDEDYRYNSSYDSGGMSDQGQIGGSDAILSNAPGTMITILFILYIVLYIVDVFFRMNRGSLFYIFFYSYVLLGVFMFLMDCYRPGMFQFNLIHLLYIVLITLLMIYLPLILNLISSNNYWFQALLIVLCPIFWFFFLFVEKTSFLFKIQTFYMFFLFILAAFYMISIFSLSTQISDEIESTLKGTQLGIGIFDGLKEIITNPFNKIVDNTKDGIEQVQNNLNNEIFYFKYGYYPESLESTKPGNPRLFISFNDRNKIIFEDSEESYFAYTINLENYGKPINISTNCYVKYNNIEYNAYIKTNSQNSQNLLTHNFKLINAVPITCYYDFRNIEKPKTNLVLYVNAIMHMDSMSLYNPYAIIDTEVMNLNQDPLNLEEKNSVSNVYQPGPIAINLLTNLNYIVLSENVENSIVETLELTFEKKWEGDIENFRYVYIKTPKAIPIKHSINTGYELMDQTKIKEYCIDPCQNSRGDVKQCESLCDTNNYNFYSILEDGIKLLNNQIKIRDDNIGGFRFILDTSNPKDALNYLKKNQVFFSAYVAFDYKVTNDVSYELVKFESD